MAPIYKKAEPPQLEVESDKYIIEEHRENMLSGGFNPLIRLGLAHRCPSGYAVSTANLVRGHFCPHCGIILKPWIRRKRKKRKGCKNKKKKQKKNRKKRG